MNLDEKLTGAQALKLLLSMRALASPTSPPVRCWRRRSDHKIVHVSLSIGDMTWYYHRGKIGGSRLILVPMADYRGSERWPRSFRLEIFPHSADDL